MERKNNTHYIYLSGKLTKTVLDSQIINWLELYQKNNIIFDLIEFISLKDWLFHKKERKFLHNKNRKVSKKIYGKIKVIFIFF